LNKTAKDKVIFKQECMCQLAKLDLFLCSKSFETVSISGEYRLCTSGESKSSFLVKYAKRDTPHSSEMSISITWRTLYHQGHLVTGNVLYHTMWEQVVHPHILLKKGMPNQYTSTCSMEKYFQWRRTHRKLHWRV